MCVPYALANYIQTETVMIRSFMIGTNAIIAIIKMRITTKNLNEKLFFFLKENSATNYSSDCAHGFFPSSFTLVLSSVRLMSFGCSCCFATSSKQCCIAAHNFICVRHNCGHSPQLHTGFGINEIKHGRNYLLHSQRWFFVLACIFFFLEEWDFLQPQCLCAFDVLSIVFAIEWAVEVFVSKIAYETNSYF